MTWWVTNANDSRWKNSNQNIWRNKKKFANRAPNDGENHKNPVSAFLSVSRALLHSELIVFCLWHIFFIGCKFVNSPQCSPGPLFIYVYFYYFFLSAKKNHIHCCRDRSLVSRYLLISFVSVFFSLDVCCDVYGALCYRYVYYSVSTSCRTLPLMCKIIEISRWIVYKTVLFYCYTLYILLFTSISISGDVCVCARALSAHIALLRAQAVNVNVCIYCLKI